MELKKREKNAIERARFNARRAKYAKLYAYKRRQLEIKCFPDGVPKNSDEQNDRNIINTLEVNHGQILAHSTLYLWKRLYSKDNKKTLWDRSIKHVFPEKSLTQGEVAKNLEVIHIARNRIAHHEPIYGERLDKTYESIQFIRKELGREANETNSDFMKFSEKQNDRLCSDYAEFTKKWKLITSQK